MKVVSVRAYRYDIPFRRPFETSQGALRVRSGLILEAEADNGRVGYGEVAPLTGFSRESLEECIIPVRNLSRDMINLQVPTTPDDLANWIKTHPTAPASVVFGIESALSDLAAQQAELPLAKWYRHQALLEVPVNAVLSGDDIEQQARTKAEHGYRAFKLKIGALTIDQDLNRIALIRGAIGPKAALRLDANRAYQYSDAETLLRALNPYAIEYVEEPLHSPTADEMRALRSTTGIPVAIDESLMEWERRAHVDDKSILLSHDVLAAYDVAILKPALLGSIGETISLGECFLSAGKRIVVTSALDAGFALSAALHVACALQLQSACGLDTASILEDQLMTNPPTPSHGLLRLPALAGLGAQLSRSLSARQHLVSIDVD